MPAVAARRAAARRAPLAVGAGAARGVTARAGAQGTKAGANPFTAPLAAVSAAATAAIAANPALAEIPQMPHPASTQGGGLPLLATLLFLLIPGTFLITLFINNPGPTDPRGGE